MSDYSFAWRVRVLCRIWARELRQAWRRWRRQRRFAKQPSRDPLIAALSRRDGAPIYLGSSRPQIIYTETQTFIGEIHFR